jgi:hypothetical protein
VLRPRLFLLASWGATTVAATLISAAGVSIVTRDVTDEHAPALRGRDVIALLSAPLPAPEPPPTTAAEPPSTPPETTPPVSTAPPETAPPTTSTVPPPTSPPATSPPPPTTPVLADAIGGTFSADGGTMTVACLGESIALVSARPNDGFRLVVEDQGSARVHVRFERDGRGDGELAAVCRRGEPVLREGSRDDRRDRDRGEDRDVDRDDDRDGRDRDGETRSDEDDRDGRDASGRGG